MGGCEKGTCPEDSFCILFRPEPDRLTNTYCMKSCEDSSDCRDDYLCKRADQLEGEKPGQTLAENLDKSSGKFCTVRADK